MKTLPTRPKHWVLILAGQGIICTLLTVITGNLTWIALGTLGGYLSQGIFVRYATKRMPYELLFGAACALIAIFTGKLELQFLGRLVFIGNAAFAAYKILDKEGY